MSDVSTVPPAEDPSGPAPTQLGTPAAIVLADGRRFALGAPGDWFLIGDWDCDGETTPALYRPSTGDVFVFERWAADGPLESRPAHPTGVIDGRPRVVRRGDCDHVVVDPP